jgi:cytochrome b561
LPPIDEGLLYVIARVTHWMLYVLLILTVSLGIATEWTRGADRQPVQHPCL